MDHDELDRLLVPRPDDIVDAVAFSQLLSGRTASAASSQTDRSQAR